MRCLQVNRSLQSNGCIGAVAQAIIAWGSGIMSLIGFVVEFGLANADGLIGRIQENLGSVVRFFLDAFAAFQAHLSGGSREVLALDLASAMWGFMSEAGNSFGLLLFSTLVFRLSCDPNPT